MLNVAIVPDMSQPRGGLGMVMRHGPAPMPVHSIPAPMQMPQPK